MNRPALLLVALFLLAGCGSADGFAPDTLVAAVFVIAPHSRFGVWLDHFLPRLREERIAYATMLALWLASALVMLVAESLR